MDQYIIGYFKSQQKDTSCQGNLHQHKVSKCKNYQNRDCRGHLVISKKVQDHIQMIKIKRVMIGAS